MLAAFKQDVQLHKNDEMTDETDGISDLQIIDTPGITNDNMQTDDEIDLQLNTLTKSLYYKTCQFFMI